MLYKGLRVRMGVHVGTPRMVRDPMTRRMEYIGPVVNAAARITALTHGGQIVMSQATYIGLRTTSRPRGRSSLGSVASKCPTTHEVQTPYIPRPIAFPLF